MLHGPFHTDKQCSAKAMLGSALELQPPKIQPTTYQRAQSMAAMTFCMGAHPAVEPLLALPNHYFMDLVI